ncbi:response regulator receiver domain [Altibacter lentus]|uniref:response regulator receiver domain n=1 Tax=Altibacter lentus TaxID=1223410 RepID=UPI0005560793|nr:response regulator receiver domain [Altibacter lentus]
MNPNFDTIASTILQNSIKSAIFIDDRVLLPFEAKTDPDILDYSNLIAPFEERGCTLSFYRFGNEWRTKANFLFNNRDLLILDWQLRKNQDTYSDTFAILQEAVQTNSLHFCCIYTDTNPNAFIDKIIFPVLYYFGYCIKLTGAELSVIRKQFIGFCDGEGLDSEEVIAVLNPLFREYILYSTDSTKKRELTKQILDYLKESFSDFQQIRNGVREITGDLGRSFAALAYAFEEQSIPICEITHRIRIRKTESDNWRLYVNNTIIAIANKDSIQEQLFYEEFKNSIVDEHNIFLTLLGLEMRNAFRKGSGFIGKELDEIDETAFFYHHQNIQPKDAFYEFLRELWVDQATHFLSTDEPTLYSTLEEYKANNNIDSKVNDFEQQIQSELIFQEALVKLNNFYNQLRFNPQGEELLSFGDVLKLKKGNNTIEYVMCITPLCDCADPVKIKRQYFFVRYETVIESYLNSLKKAEGKYISYLRLEDGILCIDWGECKPFSMYVRTPKLGSLSKVCYQNEWFELEHLGRIKENFAQRIANKALSYPARVGVSLAQII